MATIFTTGTTGNDTFTVNYDQNSADTQVLDALSGDDIVYLNNSSTAPMNLGYSIDGGADFDILILGGANGTTADYRNLIFSNFENIQFNMGDGTVNIGARFTATQLQSLGPNLSFDLQLGPFEFPGNKLHVYLDPGQSFDMSGYSFANWKPDSASGFTNTFMYGASGNETLVGSVMTDTINGGAGDDIIDGGARFDYLYGGDGDDVIYSGSVNATSGNFLDGGAGDDVLWSNLSSGNTLVGGLGADTYHTFINASGIVETGTDIDTVISHFAGICTLTVENLSIAAGILGSGNGNIQNNVMTGNSLANTLNGLGGDDTISGGLGSDTLDGGLGSDTINGGNGDDIISGGNDNDILRGNADSDAVLGGGGDDILRGDAGTDVITGGAGRDTMYAGLADSAADSFVFAAISDSGLTTLTRDRVFEFVAGEDKIDLSLIDADSAPGNGQFSFIGSAAFTAEGQVRVVAAGANTLIQINSSGIGGADSSIMIMGVAPSALTAGDFIL